MKDYIQTYYGVCQMMRDTGKCRCRYKQLNELSCENYRPVKAETWDQLAKEAKSATR